MRCRHLKRLMSLLHVCRLATETLAVRLPILKWLNVPMPYEYSTDRQTDTHRPDCIIRLSLSPYSGKRNPQHSDDEGKLKQIFGRRKRRWKNDCQHITLSNECSEPMREMMSRNCVECLAPLLCIRGALGFESQCSSRLNWCRFLVGFLRLFSRKC